jgi:aspartate/methionine/tyrosine aminotransferase
VSEIGRKKISAKADQFSESVIREMTRVALQHDAVNLAQGFPDFPCPLELKQAANEAIEADVNQYAITWGDVWRQAASLREASPTRLRPFRQAIASKVR